MDGKVEILGKEWLSQGFMKLAKFTLRHERFDGGMLGPMTREIVMRTSAVAVLPYDPVTDKILLIEQFRVAAHLAGFPAWQRELIAGIADREEGIEDLARREALEEANCTVTDLVEMFRYLPSPGMTNEVLVFFCGRMDSSHVAGVHGLAEEHEDIRSTLYDFDRIADLLERGSTGNGPLISALQWMLLNRERVRKLWR
ncbi:MAG TPA: NUDIX domain-containing protein [Dongiaceae bacterium]|nr:NUDIX domain-containing protein [Dongiaceae bacterium]